MLHCGSEEGASVTKLEHTRHTAMLECNIIRGQSFLLSLGRHYSWSNGQWTLRQPLVGLGEVWQCLG